MLIYTIGHSTREIDEFLNILKHCGIEIVADVRHYPSSRKFPWFNKEELQKSLQETGIRYFWLESLGGFRKGGYSEYTGGEEYKEGIEKLLKIATQGITAVMCAEILWFRCHRRYISETLEELGHRVIHIYNLEKTQEHKSKETEGQMKLKIFCDRVKY